MGVCESDQVTRGAMRDVCLPSFFLLLCCRSRFKNIFYLGPQHNQIYGQQRTEKTFQEGCFRRLFKILLCEMSIRCLLPVISSFFVTSSSRTTSGESVFTFERARNPRNPRLKCFLSLESFLIGLYTNPAVITNNQFQEQLKKSHKASLFRV